MWQSIWPGTPYDAAAGEVRHQRRARADLDLVGDRAPLRGVPRARLARAPRRPGVRRTRAGDSRREAVGARQALRAYLFNFVRERARQRWSAQGAASRVVAAGTMFDQNTLTIGFARRFTSYKRPELIFSDADRLARILNASGRPVQLVFAGKAHPADEVGKHHLQRIYRSALDPEVRRPHRVRRRLRPARRALPRAGMRRVDEQSAQAARGERHERHEGGDQRHAAPVDRRRLVGRRIHRRQRLAHRRPRRPGRPGRAGLGGRAGALRAARGAGRARVLRPRRDGIPRRWLQVVKQSIRTVLPRFSARRMVKEYVRDMYLPALKDQAVTK